VTVEQIAKDFGVYPMTLFKWLRQADIDAGATPGTVSSEPVELREARKRIRLLEQENEVLRRGVRPPSVRSRMAPRQACDLQTMQAVRDVTGTAMPVEAGSTTAR
jgi:transposase-like protein